MFLEGYEPTNPDDVTSGLFDYFNDFFPSPLGNVNDDTGATSYSIRYYAGLGFGGWSSETNWTTSSNIAVNKTFSASDVVNGIPKSGVNPVNLSTSAYFTPSIGYTISFLRDGQDPFIKGSKVNMVLDFADTVIDSNLITLQYSSGSSGSYIRNYVETFSSIYSNSSLSMLDLSTIINYSGYVVFGFDNVITIGAVTVNGDYIEIDKVYNSSGINVNVSIPEDVQYLTVDVEYNAKNIKTISGSSSTVNVSFPLVYNFDLSGQLTLEEGSITTGLLQGIIEWLRNILNAIRELPDKIVDGIKVVLQELFVPSPEFVSGKFEEFKLLAESKLGFLFTMLDMVVELFTTLSTNISQPMDTLTIPSLVLPFPYADGGQMVLWEDMTFKVFPDGLDVLLNLVHLLTSIVIITATINFSVGYIRRFFEKG